MHDLPVSLALAQVVRLYVDQPDGQPGALQPPEDRPMLGMTLELVSLVCGVLGKQFLRLGLVRSRPLVCVFGFVLQSGVGAVLDSWALAIATQSVIVLLGGAFDAIGTLLVAPWLLNETVTRGRMCGAAFVAFGTVVAASVGPEGNPCCELRALPGLLSRPSVAFWALCFISILSASWKEISQTRVCGERVARRGLAFAAVGGMFAGNSWCLSLALRLVKTDHVADILASPLAWMTFGGAALSAFLSMWFMVRGTAEFETVFLVPVVDGARIISGAAGGMLVLDEARGLPASQLAIYVGALLAVILGIVALYREQAAQARSLADIGQELAAAEPAGVPPHVEARPASFLSRIWGHQARSVCSRGEANTAPYVRELDPASQRGRKATNGSSVGVGVSGPGLALFGSAGTAAAPLCGRPPSDPGTELLSFHSFCARPSAQADTPAEAAGQNGNAVAKHAARPIRPM